MAECKECNRSGWLVRTNGRGMCRACDRELWAKAEAERARVKEALIFSRVLKSPQDRALHLRRAMDGVRALARYERQGCAEIHPSPAELLKVLEGKLEELEAEHGPSVSAGGAKGSEAASGEGEGKNGEHTGVAGVRRREEEAERRERRFWPRRAAGFIGHLRVAGLRARAEDVSARGVRVLSSFVRGAGSSVDLSFQTPSGRVATQALVRWVLPLRATQGGKGEMGLELLGKAESLTQHLPEEAAG